MTLEPQRREAEDEQRPPTSREGLTPERDPKRVKPEDGQGSPAPLRAPSPRLQYASPDLQRPASAELPRDRLTALTRAALEALGGSEERALLFTPEEDVLTRLVNDESLDLTPRSDLTPLIPEEQSRGLSGSGKQEGKAFEEDFRREAELKPDDLEDIARERRELVQQYYAHQGHALVDQAELTQLVGAPTAQAAPEREPDGADGAPAEQPHAGEAGRAVSAADVLRTEGGERALQAVTQRLATGFQQWLRQEGHWHKRSEWLKKHLARTWEYAADALNPHTLLLAPKGHSRFASFVQAESPDPELQNDKLPEKDRSARKDEARERTRRAAKNGQFERQIKEARRAVITATTKTIMMSWADARDPSWHLDATPDDATAGLKSPQNHAIEAWLTGANT